MRDLHNASVVITGASSGIGRATACAFAREGARLTLAARRKDALAEVVRECVGLGAPSAIAVPTDVTDAAAVERLAEQARSTCGGIDVWINNAGVGLFGPYEAARIEAHRRVVETNLFGTMHGAAAVLPIFRAQGRGVLINNISIGGWSPVPFAAAYTASKFGLRGFTASLRQELADEPHIHVCGVFPAAIDTPGYVHGANVSGKALTVSGPILAPEEVADAMLQLALQPQDEMAVGVSARMARIAYGLAPRTTEHAMGMLFRWYVRRDGPPAPITEGSLFQPVAEGTAASGGMRDRPSTVSRQTALVGLAAVGAALGLGLLLTRARRAG